MTRFGCLLVAALLALTACGPSAEPAGASGITVNPDTPFDPVTGPEPAQDTAADAPPADAGAEPPADADTDAARRRRRRRPTGSSSATGTGGSSVTSPSASR